MEKDKTELGKLSVLKKPFEILTIVRSILNISCIILKNG